MQKPRMKALVAALCLAAALAPALSAQERLAQERLAQVRPAQAQEGYGLAQARADYRLLSLSEDELSRARRLVERDARDLELARAEIRELQARLARLLLADPPDLGAVKATVRESLEAEYRVRMIQIERNIALRGILGDRRWAALSRLSRGFGSAARSGELRDLAERAGDQERLAELAQIIKALQ